MSQDNEAVTAIRETTTLPRFVRAVAAAYGERIAVRLDDENGPVESLSYAALEQRSALIARGLMARGVGKGSRVGFIFGNGPGFAVMLFAIARIGAIAVPISTMIRANELVRVLRQSDISGLIVQRTFLGNDYVERLCDALPGLSESGPELRLARVPFLRWMVSTGEGLPGSVRPMDWLTDAAASMGEDLLVEAESEVHVTDQLIEIYTSGSMALPKGVRHMHGPVLFRTHYMRTMVRTGPDMEVYAQLPMFWVGGLMMYLMPNLEAGAITTCTEKTLSNSRFAMGSVLAEEDLKVLAAAPKPWWGLGMSETLGPYSYGDEFRAEGYPVCAPLDNWADGYEVRIADENNQPVADGEVGELQIRGYPVTPGLHKVEREGYYTADGFYHTGDLCKRDGKRTHFVGRDGDMIKTAGSNVSPAEVEMEMQALDGVHAAYVLGLPDAERGQLLVAAVVPRDGASLDFEAIQKELRQKLSAYKVPRAYELFQRDEVPLLHSNKVARREIAAIIAKRLGREV